MNIEKFTAKSQEAINDAQALAVEYNHQEIHPMHLFLALLNQDNGLVSAIIDKAGASSLRVKKNVIDRLKAIPAVSGPGAQQVYLAKDTVAALNEAVKIAGKMKDEYVSVEHIFLALVDKSRECKESVESAGITYNQVLETPVSRMIISGELKDGQALYVDVKGEELVFVSE